MSPTQTHAKLVIVDDDSLFRESVQENLSDFGYQTTAFSNGPEALEYLRSNADTDLILLDWKMPQMTGIEVLEALRKGENETPVIFLTVLGDQIYEEAALHGGAVDFVEKSRSFSILLRRIQLILGGTKSGEGKEGANEAKQAPAKIGALHLHRQSGRAEWKGDEVALTLTEFRIVDLIAGRQGRDVRYREIYDVVHGEHFVAGSGESGYRANVRSAIKRIRHKFRTIDPDFEAIENYPGFGYRWRA